eukprot:12088907-Alexandrium_andersonii.AAC.1
MSTVRRSSARDSLPGACLPRTLQSAQGVAACAVRGRKISQISQQSRARASVRAKFQPWP